MKGVNIFLADGFEDMEALATNDVLRRGGVNTQLISITDEPFVCSSHGITVGIETFLSDIDANHGGTDAKDVMIFPGGMPGTRNLAKCRALIGLMRDHYAAGGTLAAICAAPGLVLSQLEEDMSWLEFTCFEGFEPELQARGARYNPVPAVTCGRVITGRSAGYAIPFALQVLERVKGVKAVQEVDSALHSVK